MQTLSFGANLSETSGSLRAAVTFEEEDGVRGLWQLPTDQPTQHQPHRIPKEIRQEKNIPWCVFFDVDKNILVQYHKDLI